MLGITLLQKPKHKIQAFLPEKEHFIFQLFSRSVLTHLKIVFLTPKKNTHKNKQPTHHQQTYPVLSPHPSSKTTKFFVHGVPRSPSGFSFKGKKLRCQPISMLILGGSMYKSRGEWMDLRQWRVGKLAVCQDCQDLRRFFWIWGKFQRHLKNMLVKNGNLTPNRGGK